jgi:hypothetical protein
MPPAHELQRQQYDAGPQRALPCQHGAGPGPARIRLLTHRNPEVTKWRTRLDKSSFVPDGVQTVNRLFMRLSGGRVWWAHFEFTRINIEPIILKNKIEELHAVRSFRTPACPCDLIGQLLLTQRQHWIDSRSSQCWQTCSRDDHRRHRDDDDKDCGTV